MAGDWIEVQTCTPDKPEVHQLAEILEIEPDAIVGKLIRIWAWADMHTVDGNASSVTRSLLDRITNVSGFADALSKVGWLKSMTTGVHFTNFDRHNGETAKTRALTGKRVAKSRSKAESVTEEKRDCNGNSVTNSLPEKRREESLDGEPSSVSKRFSKPTISQLEAYALSVERPDFDAEAFMDYYESVGWTIGKNKPMKSWKGAVSTWLRRNKPVAKQSRIIRDREERERYFIENMHK